MNSLINNLNKKQQKLTNKNWQWISSYLFYGWIFAIFFDLLTVSVTANAASIISVPDYEAIEANPNNYDVLSNEKAMRLSKI